MITSVLQSIFFSSISNKVTILQWLIWNVGKLLITKWKMRHVILNEAKVENFSAGENMVAGRWAIKFPKFIFLFKVQKHFVIWLLKFDFSMRDIRRTIFI